VYEVSEKWGGVQTVIGPIITIPYTVYYQGDKENLLKRTEYAQFLPDRLGIDTEILPEVRFHGIFDIVVYTLSMRLQGSFGALPLEDLKIPEEGVLWGYATLIMSITDMRGLNEGVDLILIMFLTRKNDWYTVRLKSSRKGSSKKDV
jgi:inner membrane protein